ncbi:hypothetical protein CRYUN_Cryun40dG0017400 [Craigia yunnanensis]
MINADNNPSPNPLKNLRTVTSKGSVCLVFEEEKEKMVGREIEELSEEERRALRGSKFAPLPSLLHPSRSQPRLAHPGGPLTTNKAAALAKFLERKVLDPNGFSSINPDLLELAVNNAKATVFQGGTSNSGSMVRHVDSFGDSEVL